MRSEKSRRKIREPVVPDYRMRRRVLLGCMSLGGLALLWSAGERHILQTDYLQHEGKKRYLRALEIPVHRGEILDRHGEALAQSTPVITVWADPRQLAPNAALLGPLSKLLEIDPDALRRRLARHGSKGFIYLKRGVKPEIGQRALQLLDTHGAGGVGFQREYRRYYPTGEVTAHVVGLTDIDDQGQEGLELSYNQWLSGSAGLRRVIQDGRGRVVEEVESLRSPSPGKSITLSLDRRLQFLAYRELKRAVDDHRARGGAAVILDPASGEILAMVSQPSYNPNDRTSIRPSKLRNRAVTDVFEPGSTMKPLAVAAVLEAGKARPHSPVDTAPGYWRVGRNLVRDHRNYGLLDVTAVLTKSSNVGVSKLALELEPETLWRSYQSLGFGTLTASQFPGEVAGQLPYFDGWSRFEQATHSFGYGLSVTTLQLAQAYAVLAADGVHRPVSLLKLDQPVEQTRVMRAATAREVRRMMETVVSAEGTAKRAAVEGYRVAGKTGTVKKAEAGGYSKDKYQSVFVGMLPSDRPRLVMAVMVDEPRNGDYYGGLVAAPVFSSVMTDAMRLLNVVPDAGLPATARLARTGVAQ